MIDQGAKDRDQFAAAFVKKMRQFDTKYYVVYPVTGDVSELIDFLFWPCSGRVALMLNVIAERVRASFSVKGSCSCGKCNIVEKGPSGWLVDGKPLSEWLLSLQ